MSSGFSTPSPGMEVLGSDGHHVGRIKEVHYGDIVVQRAFQPAVHLPLTAIHDVTPKGVALEVTAQEVDELFWVHAGEDMTLPLMNLYD